jgi:hypothetical protein
MIIDWKLKYSALAAWSQDELASICCGLNPDETQLSIDDLRGRISEQADMMFYWHHNKAATLEMIERSVRCKELVPAYQSRGGTKIFVTYFKREDAIRWAVFTGLFPNFPFTVESLPVEPVQNNETDGNASKEAQAPVDGVQVTLPHMTERLEKLFKVMRDSWGKYDPLLIPKQDNIAKVISKELGYSPDSREGKALAALIKPDELKEVDARANKKRSA